MSGFITELITSAVYCYFLCMKIKKPYKCPRYLFGICLKYCLTNVNHAVPYAMSGFRTELITSAVYCYFLCSLYKDREAIQTPELPLQKRVFHTIVHSTTNHKYFIFPLIYNTLFLDKAL